MLPRLDALEEPSNRSPADVVRNVGDKEDTGTANEKYEAKNHKVQGEVDQVCYQAFKGPTARRDFEHGGKYQIRLFGESHYIWNRGLIDSRKWMKSCLMKSS